MKQSSSAIAMALVAVMSVVAADVSHLLGEDQQPKIERLVKSVQVLYIHHWI